MHCNYQEQNRRSHACEVQNRAVETEVLGFAVASEEDQGFADRSYLSISQAEIPGQRGR